MKEPRSELFHENIFQTRNIIPSFIFHKFLFSYINFLKVGSKCTHTNKALVCLLVWRNMIYDKTVVSYSSLCVQHLVYVWHAVMVKKISVEGINKQVNKERNEGITLETLTIIQLRL